MGTMQVGALAFGLVIGWYAYSISRNRTDKVALSDITTMIGAVGGGAVLALFPQGTDMFAWYGIGLAIGFFAYFLVLLVLILTSAGAGWTKAYLIDGRRPPLIPGEDRAPVPGMGQPSEHSTQIPN